MTYETPVEQRAKLRQEIKHYTTGAILGAFLDLMALSISINNIVNHNPSSYGDNLIMGAGVSMGSLILGTSLARRRNKVNELESITEASQ